MADATYLPVDEAVKRLAVIEDYDDGGGPRPCVHTFVSGSFGLMGAHWGVEDARRAFEAHGVEESGAQGAGDEPRTRLHRGARRTQGPGVLRNRAAPSPENRSDERGRAMKYMTLYVEVIEADSSVSDDEISSATTGTLSGAPLRTRDGCIVGSVLHAQVTEGPKSTRQEGAGRA